MKSLNSFTPPSWYSKIVAVLYRVVLIPRRVFSGLLLLLFLLVFTLVLEQLWLTRATRMVLILPNPAVSYRNAIRPADFTPVASPPPAFAETSPVAQIPWPQVTPQATAKPRSESSSRANIVPSRLTATPVSLDTILAKEARYSDLKEEELISILLLGTDARKDEYISRTDSLIVAILNLTSESVTLISIPRDLWVLIPGYGQGRVNTAYFLGETESEGPYVARQTVSHVLGIPIDHSLVINFDGFRRMVDAIDGINVFVPEAIDDAAFPDESYGTYRLLIPSGYQHMDGELALAYARTRHGNSDLHRAQRQQDVLKAIWRRVVSLEQLPALPSFLKEGTSEIKTTLDLTDMFFLARVARALSSNKIQSHVIGSPLLWNGTTADGQMVLLYDPYTLQITVEKWIDEAANPSESQKRILDYR